MIKFICIHGNIGVGKSTYIENISKQQPDINYVCLQEPLDKWGQYLQKYYDALDYLQQLPRDEIHNPANAQTVKAQQDIINFEVIITNIRLQQYAQIRQLRYQEECTSEQPIEGYVYTGDKDIAQASEQPIEGYDHTDNKQSSQASEQPIIECTCTDVKEIAYVFERSIEESWVIFCQTLRQYLTNDQWSFLKYFFEVAIQQEVKFDIEMYLEAPTSELFKRIHNRGRKEETDMSFEYLNTLNEAYEKYYQDNADKLTKL